MNQHNGIFRNELDYLITDTLPEEMPVPFSFYSLYKWLNDSSTKQWQEFRRLAKFNSPAAKGFPSPSWASYPHRFEVMKKDGGTRLLSCPTPLGALAMTAFVIRYQKDFLYDFSKPSFSIRRPIASSSLVYVGNCKKGKSKQITYISDFQGCENRLMEKTGMFFDIRPMHTLSSLRKSPIWKECINMFPGEKHIHLDIANCFPSIYTHSLGWFYPNEGAEGMAFLNSNDFRNALDRTAQRINANQTHGIMVGPEFSRMAAETLLEEIDRRTTIKLLKKSLRQNIDYTVLRFVDDYWIFGKDEETREVVSRALENECKRFFLRINTGKTNSISNDLSIPIWERQARAFVAQISHVIETANDASKGKHLSTQIHFLLEGLLMSVPSSEEDACSFVAYVTTALYNLFKRRKIMKRFFSLACQKAEILDAFVSFSVALCDRSARFYNIQKLANMYFYLERFLPAHRKAWITEAIKKSLSKKEEHWLYRLIKEKRFYDLMPLLLQFGAFHIKINKDALDAMIRDVFNSDDGVLCACLLLYTMQVGGAELKKECCQKIEAKIDEICDGFFLALHYKNLFLYPTVWFFLVFINCPHLPARVLSHMKTIISCAEKETKDASRLVCGFINCSDCHLFDWKFYSSSSLRRWHYSTDKRMLLLKGDAY